MAGTSGDAQAMQEIWVQAVDGVKREVIAPSLWRALEKTVPVAWEENTFVVGLASADGALAGQMNSGEHRSTIERTLRALSGNAGLNFRLIEGTERADWEYAKARDAAARQQQQQATQRKFKESAAYASWDEVHDQMSRLWSSAEYRSLATGKARYLDQALALASRAMDELLPEGAKTDEQSERGLSRVVERIASMAGTDATLVAFLLFERRRKGGAA